MMYQLVARLFLSTLSLRRATLSAKTKNKSNRISIHALLAESDACLPACVVGVEISIHALLAESDGKTPASIMSHLDFYPRSPCGERPRAANCQHRSHQISIHALLAESDLMGNPLLSTMTISIHALLAESDYTMTTTICTASKFLSTLSLRRATQGADTWHKMISISIHALLAESDLTKTTM